MGAVAVQCLTVAQGPAASAGVVAAERPPGQGDGGRTGGGQVKVIDRYGAEYDIPDCADKIASNLVAGGYPGTTAGQVREQLAKPHGMRDIIGMFALSMIEDAALLPEPEDEARP
jgi:hypothetical protein